MPSKIYLKPDQVEDFVSMYTKGYSITEIANCYKHTRKTVTILLEYYGVKIRNRVNKYGSAKRKVDYTKRFWNSFYKDPTGCWIWTKTKDKSGYGRLCSKKQLGEGKAHRVSWVLHFGKIPKGFYVCHTCDNPPCVNPEHLFLGTQKDNMKDMVSKGRSNKLKGSDNGQSLLKREDVIKIRKLLNSESLYQKDIGKLFGVSQTAISEIKRGVTYIDLEYYP